MIVTSLSARWRLFRTAARMNRRRRRARMLRSPLAGLIARTQRCDEILLVPSDLRTPDPHFASEVRSGFMVLAGESVELRGTSPFAVENAGDAWHRELHGFSWLNHLAAAGEEGRDLARDLVHDWIRQRRPASGPANGLEVTARRVISWLSHSGLVLDGADPADFRLVMRALAFDLHQLEIRRHEELPGFGSLLAASALLLADLALAGRDQGFAATERTFLTELAEQILPDGGHVSRNSGTVLALLLDLLPLRRCYPVREREPPPALLKALEAMSGYLRAMRLGDGSLACFNGMGPTPLDALATMLTIETGSAFSPLAASGYVRATAGDLVLVMDCGKAPPAEHSAEAQAGCLSFELSDGPSALLVNTGFPAQGSPAEIAVARAGTSHNTLTLDGRSSARMVTHTPLGLVAERAALAGPPGITHALAASADGTTITASHEGYLTSHQLVHTRRLVVATSGDLVTGVDRVGGRQGSVRLRKDIPVAIRFHLAPGCLARPVGDTLAAIEIATSHGKLWQLTVEGAETFVEPSVVYGHHASARPSQQIVLRASTNGDTTVSWALARTK